MSGSAAEPERQGRPEPTQRLFFALWPPEELRAAFARATRKAAGACGGRPVPVATLHITLAFLGSVPERRIAELGSLARQVAAELPRIELTFDRLEHWAKPQLLCATASVESPHATALSGALRAASEQRGFRPDLKPFRAHVTVARKVLHPTRHDMPPVTWTAAGFALVSSRTDPAGPAYSVIESYALDGRTSRP